MIPWRDALEFERTAPEVPGEKHRLIRDRFGVSPARYYQDLSRILDTEAAFRFDPATVARLRRVRDRRRLIRSARRLGLWPPEDLGAPRP